MKTIYLHIGIGKTGTTTIQKCLSMNHQYLLSQDLHYIQCCGGQAGVGHQNFAKSFIENVPAYMQGAKSARDHMAEVAAEVGLSTSHNILLSSENFPVAQPRAIKDFFDGLPGDFSYKIILFVRSQDELAESEYNQIIKVRAERRSFVEYIGDEFEGDFFKLANQWAAVFGSDNLICRVFDAGSQSVMRDFLSCLPISPDQLSDGFVYLQKRDNKSLGHAQIIIKRMLNILLPACKDNTHVELPRTIVEAFSDIDIVTVHMNSKQAKKMRKKYARCNRRFNHRFLGINTSALGGRRYSDQQRDQYFSNCKQLIEIFDRF